MKLAIIAATGQVGSLILKKALAAGFDTTAIVRNAAKLKDQPNAVIQILKDGSHQKEHIGIYQN